MPYILLLRHKQAIWPLKDQQSYMIGGTLSYNGRLAFASPAYFWWTGHHLRCCFMPASVHQKDNMDTLTPEKKKRFSISFYCEVLGCDVVFL